MSKRNVLSQIILSLFIALPLLLFFQNCGGSGSSAGGGRGGGVQSDSLYPLKVSGSIIAGGGVNAEQFQLTTDGSRVVFTADREVAGRMELYSVRRDGSALVKLSAGGNVDSFQMAGDLQVVYLAEETANQSGLFAVDLDGNNRRTLSGSLVAGGNVLDYQISSDQKTAIFRADKALAGTPEVWSCNLIGLPTVTRLHTPGSVFEVVEMFQAVGQTVILRGNLGSTGQEELFAVAFDGTGFLKISGPLAAVSAGVGKFASDNTGSVIVYLADALTPGKNDLFLTGLSGGASQLNQPPVFGGQVRDFDLSAQGDHVVYAGDLDVYGRDELYTRDLIGMTAPFKLNKNLVSGGNVTSFSTFTGMTIVSNSPVLKPGVSFVADANIDDQFELFIATDLSALGQQVNGSLVAGGDVLQSTVSADGQRAIYIADQNQSGVFELFSKSLVAGAGAATVLVEPDPDKGVVPPFGFSPDNTRILFVADLNSLHQRELWSVGANGSALRRLSRAHASESGVAAYKFSADGHWLAYVGDQDTTGVSELYIAPSP